MTSCPPYCTIKAYSHSCDDRSIIPSAQLNIMKTHVELPIQECTHLVIWKEVFNNYKYNWDDTGNDTGIEMIQVMIIEMTLVN